MSVLSLFGVCSLFVWCVFSVFGVCSLFVWRVFSVFGVWSFSMFGCVESLGLVRVVFLFGACSLRVLSVLSLCVSYHWLLAVRRCVCITQKLTKEGKGRPEKKHLHPIKFFLGCRLHFLKTFWLVFYMTKC